MCIRRTCEDTRRRAMVNSTEGKPYILKGNGVRKEAEDVNQIRVELPKLKSFELCNIQLCVYERETGSERKRAEIVVVVLVIEVVVVVALVEG